MTAGTYRRRWGGGRALLLAATLATGATTVAPMTAAAQRTPSVAVLDFETRSRYWRDRLPASAAAQLVTRLVEAGHFDVIDRDRLEAIVREQDMSVQGATDLALQLGEIKAVDYVISGTISAFEIKSYGVGPVSYTEADATLDIRIIDTSTAEIVAAVTGSGTKRMGSVDGGPSMSWDAGVAESALQPATEDVVQQLSELAGSGALPATIELEPPVVVGTDEGVVDISQGSVHGIAVGQRFEVHRFVREIVVGGEVMEVVAEQVGVVEVTRVFDEVAIAEIVEGEATVDDTLRPVRG